MPKPVKRVQSKVATDRHRSRLVVRLPEEYREILRQLRDKTDRPRVADFRRALDAYLRSHGIAPPNGRNRK
jgi:hypothetical protein